MNSIHMSWPAVPCTRLLLLVTLLLSAGCAQTPARTGEVPAQERLSARVEAWYRAAGTKDVNAMYAMIPPYVRSQMTLEQFKKSLGSDEELASVPHMQISASVEKPCSCTTDIFMAPTPTTRCVLLMNLIVTDAAGKQAKYKNLEMWEYLDSEWYIGYSGEGEDTCPPSREELLRSP